MSPEPLVPVPFDVVATARDQLAADIKSIEAGEVSGISPRQLAMLKQRLADLEEVIRKHKATRH